MPTVIQPGQPQMPAKLAFIPKSGAFTITTAC